MHFLSFNFCSYLYHYSFSELLFSYIVLLNPSDLHFPFLASNLSWPVWYLLSILVPPTITKHTNVRKHNFPRVVLARRQAGARVVKTDLARKHARTRSRFVNWLYNTKRRQLSWKCVWVGFRPSRRRLRRMKNDKIRELPPAAQSLRNYKVISNTKGGILSWEK